ncbi:carboxymuconolactone decarboxylase family protein [Actinomadura sediminis]|uniref:Carboxymuconolactone decarboxylase family protein n=1 Tax=Actinomadura sediminis TaxID=1038904 RepID=A0ABW3EM53_9ACTN
MTSRLMRRALDRSLGQVRYVAPVRTPDAGGPVAAVYAQLERDFGMLAPPIALHSPAPGTLAAAWLLLRETLVAGDPAGRPDREAIAIAVSRANSCPYCTTVHEAALHAQASRGGAGGPPGGPGRERLAAWAAGTGRRDGERPPAPFGEDRYPRYMGVAFTFHYLNRMANVFLAESPVPAEVPAPARRPVLRMVGRAVRGPAADAEPGAALGLLPEASLPDDLGWAAGDRAVAGALARAAAAVEAAGRRSVPEPVRELVASRLARWDGASPGMGRGWVEDAVRGLPDGQRPAGRLALLTALASYRVGVADVTAYRRTEPADRALVELTAWASLTAARRLARR